MGPPAGSSRLLRELNEAAALGHLLERGPLTRGELRELTGLAKPTTSEVMRRLQEAGLARVVGRTSGGPGPNAEIYAVDPDAAYGAAVSLRASPVQAHEPAAGDSTLVTAVCDLTGEVRAQTETTVDFTVVDPVDALREAVRRTARSARIPLRRITHVQLAVPGSVHEKAGVIRYVDVPGWARPGLVSDLRKRLRVELGVDNDVNLAAVAERRHGTGAGAESFALLWLGEEGLGLAIDLGGTLLRGARGGAGEIGYMPVGVPQAPGDRSAAVRDFHDLVSGTAVRALAREHGVHAATGQEAVGSAGQDLLETLAVRIAVGLAAVIAVLDPPLVVLAGEVGRAGGTALATAVEAALHRLSVLATTVATTGVTGDAVLLGCLDTTLAAVRAPLLVRGPTTLGSGPFV
jgi:predicted NBD/HSP70 family sugar kinase